MRKRLKIAYLTPHIRCDPNRTQFQRPKHLSLRNTVFILTGKETALPKEVEKKLRIIRGPLKFGRLSSRPLYPVWCIYKVLKLHRKVRFDLVYSTYDCFSSMSSALLKPLGFKWVADIWDHPELWKAVRAGGIMKRLLVNVPRIATFEIVKRALKHADLVISAIHPSALTKFRIRPQRILAITNGVDLSITRPKGLKRSDSEFKLFYVGFLMKERGLDLMLNTVALLKGRIESLKLILVGDAKKEDVAHLNRTAKNLDLEQHVDFLGRLNHENVLTQMEGSDVCLFPFPRQAAVNCIYPVKIFEYMAMGKAIVATRLEGVSSIIKDGINGLLVDPGDAREMADAVFEIHENPDLRRRLEANAKKDVEEYDWKKINKKIDERLLGYNIRRK